MAVENAFPDLERELDFIPLGVPNPKVLTKEQIEHYNEFGYVAPIAVFSESEVAEIRDYFDNLLPQAMEAGWGQYVSLRAEHTRLHTADLYVDLLPLAGAHELAQILPWCLGLDHGAEALGPGPRLTWRYRHLSTLPFFCEAAT